MAAVVVNECKITETASAPTAQWWCDFRRFHPDARFTPLGESSIVGEMVAVECDDAEHARQLAEVFTANGIHKTAIRVCTGDQVSRLAARVRNSA